MSDPRQEAQAALGRLMELVARLRAPDGCPWDRQQTPTSASKYLLEEAFEAVEAVESGPDAHIAEELGDLLFQVIFLCQLYAEPGRFDLAQAMNAVEEKMVRRHPHVFGSVEVSDAAEVLHRWQDIKRAEKNGTDQGLLEGVPLSLPALLRSFRLGSRAATVGFDWSGPGQVWQKVAEEQAELQAAASPQEASQELGDLLFSLAQWARHRGLDPEAALRAANRRFCERFKAMEEMARQKGRHLADMKLSEQDRLWERAKRRQKSQR